MDNEYGYKTVCGCIIAVSFMGMVAYINALELVQWIAM